VYKCAGSHALVRKCTQAGTSRKRKYTTVSSGCVAATELQQSCNGSIRLSRVALEPLKLGKLLGRTRLARRICGLKLLVYEALSY
jgi:hypothetical protein